MSKKVFFSLLLMLIITFSAFAQSDEDYEYDREFIWGINKNTRGGLIGGFVFKYSTAINNRVFQTFGLELMNVKHPQEVRGGVYNGSSFIVGKQHYLYSIRTQYGRDIILFRKAPQQGVQISANFAGGPTIGLEAPYYVEVEVLNNSSAKVPYHPGIPTEQIIGVGGIFQGIEESNVVLGLNVKSSLAFEFGAFKNSVTGIEAGFLVEAFPRKIILVPGAVNSSIFPTAFLTLYYGSRR